MLSRTLGSATCWLWAGPLSGVATSADEVTGTAVDCPAFVFEDEADLGATLEADQATPSARRTPVAQKAKLIKTRQLKKADLEVGGFFMGDFLSVDIALCGYRRAKIVLPP